MSGYIRLGFVFIGAVLVTLGLLVFHAPARWLKLPVRKSIEQRWHRAICWLLGIKIEQRGELFQEKGRGVLIAANHVSWLDIVVFGALAPVSFVAKDEVKGWPVFGTFARWQESVFVDRVARRTVHEQALAINKRLAQGDNIVLFPEGTTSDGNYIYPFKSSLFGSLGVGDEALHSVIQPASIAYVSHHGLPMGRFDRPLAAWPGDVPLMAHLLRVVRDSHLGVVVSFGEPVPTDAGLNRKQICQAAQQSVAEMTSLALSGKAPLPTADKSQ